MGYALNVLNSFFSLRRLGDIIKKELPIYKEVIDNGFEFEIITESGETFEEFKTVKSYNLEKLAEKINYMIGKGRAHDVEPMLRSIISGKIKCWGWDGQRKKRREKMRAFDQYKHMNSENYHVNTHSYEPFWFCYGHFRHAKKGYILTDGEIKRIKNYFQL